MEGKKQTLARLMRRGGALRLHRRLLRPLHRRRLLIFNYHRILPDDPSFEPPFERDLYHTTASTFAAQVEWLQRHTELLSEERLLDILVRGQPYRGDRPASMITFDDGYADNYHVAFPVLRDLGAPAMLFVITHHVEEGLLGWWDVIWHLIRRSPLPEICLDGRRFSLPGQARQATDHFQERMKLEPWQDNADLLDRLGEACQCELPSAAAQRAEVLTWEQCREMDAGGMAIRSHTHTHRVLATLTREQQRQELGVSREVLEHRLARPVRSVAYPVGGFAHINQHTPALAKEVGYDLGFTYLTGHNRFGDIDRHQIRRTEGPAQLDLLAGFVTLPRLFRTIQ